LSQELLSEEGTAIKSHLHLRGAWRGSVCPVDPSFSVKEIQERLSLRVVSKGRITWARSKSRGAVRTSVRVLAGTKHKEKQSAYAQFFERNTLPQGEPRERTEVKSGERPICLSSKRGNQGPPRVKDHSDWERGKKDRVDGLIVLGE